MKRVNFLIAAALFAVSSVFVGCSDDDDITPPSIKFDNVTNNTVTLPANTDKYIVNATITSEENLKTVKVLQKTGSESIQVGQTITSFTDKKNYNLKQEITGITQDISIIVVANNGSERQSELTIKFTSAPNTPDPEPTVSIKTWENVTLKPALSDGRVNSACAASVDGTTFTPNEATDAQKAKCDFVYFYTTKGIMYSPNTAAGDQYIGTLFTNWSVKNPTLFNVLNDVDFATITASNIVATAGTPTATSAEVAPNSVVAFKTAGGKVGVFKVTAFENGSSATQGYCTISIKVVE